MPRSSLQTLLFWDCLLSLFTVYLLAQSSEKVVSRNVTFLSYHNVLGENVRYKLEAITSVNQECVFNLANHLKNESLGPYSFRPQINHTLLIEKYKLESYNVKAICIRVTPFKDNCTECHNLTQILGNIEINPYGDSDCLNFNMSCGFRPQDYNESSKSWNLLLTCSILNSHDKCLDYYKFEVTLKKKGGPSESCTNFTPDSPENPKNELITGSKFNYSFKNLKSGFYCATTYFKNEICNFDYIKCKYETEVFTINDSIPKYYPSFIVTESNFNWISALISALIFTGLMIYLIWRYKISNNNRNLRLTLPEFSESVLYNSETNKVSTFASTNCKREVTIIYTQETPEILDSIVALVKFLNVCCENVIFRLDCEQFELVRRNPHAWYKRGDLFLIVETAGAVLRELAFSDNKKISHFEEDALDPYFLHNFLRIVDNLDLSKHIVVHFSFTPSNVQFYAIPHCKRFKIVQHLPLLCHFLSYGEDLLPITEHLEDFSRKWEQSPEFGHHRLFKCDYNKNNRKRVQICSKTIVVQLFELFDDFTTCNFKPHSKYGEVGSQVLSVENAQFMFKNLTPGYYCYHVQPLGCNSDCGYFSKVYHLREDMLVPLKLLPQPRPKMESTQIAYIVCSVISGVFVVGLIIGLIIRRRLRNAPSDLQSPNKNIFIPLNEVILEDKPLKRREITILYTQETPEILNCISKLVEFLRKCCDVVIRFDMDDEVNVRKNPVAWYGRGDVFILVETEGAVYREQCCLDGKEIHHVNEDSLDSYFIHSFMRIINNPNSIIDYSKYVVLRFSYTPKRVSFKTVALSKRYVISQHLAHLCHFLTYGKDLTPTTENLLKFFNKWEHTLEYSNLDIAIKNAKYFVHANPDYVTQVFKSRN